MFIEVLVYVLTILFGISVFFIIWRKRYKIAPLICFDMILTFLGFAVISFVILFARNEELEVFLIMNVFGLFLFFLGVNDIYSALRCNQKIEAVYCGFNSYPGGHYGVTSYAPVFEYVCGGTVYHGQTAQTVPYRLLQSMIEGNSYPVYINPKYPGVYVLKRKIRFTTVICFAFAMMFLAATIIWHLH